MADLKVLCELSYPPWIFQVRNYFSVYRLFPSSPLYLILSIYLLLLMRRPLGITGALCRTYANLRAITPSLSGSDHTFMLIPAPPSLPDPCQDEEGRRRAWQTSDNVAITYRIWNPYVTAYFQQRSASGCPDASVAALRFTVGSRDDVAPVVAGSEWGVG